MEFDPTILARIQFAANISFHILFPTITIGLSWFLLYFRLRYSTTRDPVWDEIYVFWVKIFALTFALGVVTGITMSFQFGTNWPGFMEKAGNIAGPLLGYEVLTAFFLEASFLGIMLFGKSRVSNRMHLFATAMVAIGTTLSAFWILSLNSWMQTPSGYRIEDGMVFVESWMDVIFNPSFPYRLAHMVSACLLTAAFFIAGISAWRNKQLGESDQTVNPIKAAIIVAALIAPLQIAIGDLHGLNTLKYQPAKVAAMEGLWHTQTNAPLVLFALPNETTRNNDLSIEIPNLASLILTHNAAGEVKGLNEFVDQHPPVAAVFWAFRVMVAMGVLMLLVAWWMLSRILREKSFKKIHYTVLSLMTFSGWIAVLAGWYVTEIGRQPWIVYGLIKVHEVAADHPSGTILTTLIIYLLLYAFLLMSYIAALRYLAAKPTTNITLKFG